MKDWFELTQLEDDLSTDIDNAIKVLQEYKEKYKDYEELKLSVEIMYDYGDAYERVYLFGYRDLTPDEEEKERQIKQRREEQIKESEIETLKKLKEKYE